MTRPANVISLVMMALKNLSETDGSTIRKIFNYISKCYPKRAPKRRIIAALKRGIEFGIMREKRGHYFLSSSEDILTPRLKSFQLHSSIPLSVRRNNLRSTVTKKRRGKRQYFYANRQKRRKVLRKGMRKSRSPTKSYILSDMYYNPEYKDSASSIGFTEDFKETLHSPENSNL